MAEEPAVRTLRQNVRELPGTAWILIGGSFLNRFASFAMFFLVLYLARMGVSAARAGLAVSVWGVGEVLSSLVGGQLADRLGRRTTIVVSMFSSATAMVALAHVHSYGAVLPIGFLAGVASELYRPAGGALVADLVPEEQRVTAFALLRLAVNLSIAVGAALAGFLASRSFAWVFYSDAATSAGFGILALTALPEGTRVRRSDEAPGVGYHQALRDRAFALFLVSSGIAAFVYFQQNAALPLHVQRSGLSPQDFGWMLSLNGVLIVLFELPISSLTMRRPAKQMISLGFVLVGLGFGLTASAHSLPALMATVAIWTLGEMIGAPVGYAYVAGIAPQHMRGRYQGLYGLSWASGMFTAPALGGYLLARSPGAFWIGCGVLGALSGLLVLAGRPPAVPPPDAPLPEAAAAGPSRTP